MSKKFSTQACFDQVVIHASSLAQADTPEMQDAASTALREVARQATSAKVPERAVEVIEGLAAYKDTQPDWSEGSRQRFVSHMNTELPRLREALGMSRTNLADTIWKAAELIRGAFREPEYRRVILPFTVLRRLDCLLAPTKQAVLATHKEVAPKKYDLSMFLPQVTGYSFWNHSPFTFKKLLETPDELRDNLEAMVQGFSPNVARIFEKFGFMATIDKLLEKGRLFHVVQAFGRVPMDTYSVSSHDMGKAFEELLRRFNDASPAGEQYTPRDAIHLMVDILFDGDDEALSVPGVIRTMYDQTAGTGGMLSEAEEKVKQLNPDAKLKLFGQELEDETYAICMADMLIRGQDPENIKPGDTLANDQHPDERFDYQLSNPPYGVEWKPSEDQVKREHAKGAAGRFAPGLPGIGDGQMLFMLNALSKMRPVVDGKSGGRIGLVHNGSPLFTGDAGSGQSEIRRYILERDYLDAIVALPTDMFYNTNIATYLWFMSNRKPKERKGKVLLIDATNMGVPMKKNLGKKRFELSEDCQRRIVQAYHDFKNTEWAESDATTSRRRALKAKVLPASHFFYRKVTIERPLRMRFEVTAEQVGALSKDSGYKKLADGGELLAAMTHIVDTKGPQAFLDAEAFRKAIQVSDDASAKTTGQIPRKLKAKQFEFARKFFGTRDKTAKAVTDEKGNLLADSELRNSEYIAFEALGRDVATGISNYMGEEVLPHWPDALVNTKVCDKADNLTGSVGCEINFSREFHVYQPPRTRDDIKRDIEAMEAKFMEMLHGVLT